jgi:hypothetical protein
MFWQTVSSQRETLASDNDLNCIEKESSVGNRAEKFGLSLSVSRCFSLELINPARKNVIGLK